MYLFDIFLHFLNLYYCFTFSKSLSSEKKKIATNWYKKYSNHNFMNFDCFLGEFLGYIRHMIRLKIKFDTKRLILEWLAGFPIWAHMKIGFWVIVSHELISLVQSLLLGKEEVTRISQVLKGLGLKTCKTKKESRFGRKNQFNNIREHNKKRSEHFFEKTELAIA